MMFCQEHWDSLRAAIDERGLSSVVAENGERAAANLASELNEGRTLDNFDPLMGAMLAITSNAMSILGPGSLYLMAPDGTPEDPVVGYGPEYAGRTWPRCPLCYLGLAHEVSCSESRCELPKVDGYAWMIQRAADDQVEAWKALRS